MIETGQVIPATGLHLRAKPEANSEILATLPQGTVIQIDGREGNWLRVIYNFKRGYLYKSYVDVLSLPDPKPPTRYILAIWTLAGVIIAAGMAFVYSVLGWKP